MIKGSFERPPTFPQQARSFRYRRRPAAARYSQPGVFSPGDLRAVSVKPVDIRGRGRAPRSWLKSRVRQYPFCDTFITIRRGMSRRLLLYPARLDAPRRPPRVLITMLTSCATESGHPFSP